MDEYLRFLFKRALAEDTAEAWRSYALSLHKTYTGSSNIAPLPLIEELELFENTIHTVLTNFTEQHFERITNTNYFIIFRQKTPTQLVGGGDEWRWF